MPVTVDFVFSVGSSFLRTYVLFIYFSDVTKVTQ